MLGAYAAKLNTIRNTSAAENIFWRMAMSLMTKGPSIKYVTLEGEGIRESVTVCDRAGGQEHVTSRL